MLSSSTNNATMNAPAQASAFQDSNGLIAYWNTTIGTFAIGAVRSVLQNWLE